MTYKVHVPGVLVQARGLRGPKGDPGDISDASTYFLASSLITNYTQGHSTAGTNASVTFDSAGVRVSVAALGAAANTIKTVAGGYVSLDVAGATTTVSVTGVMPLSVSDNYFYTSNNTFANSTHIHGAIGTDVMAGSLMSYSSASNGLTLSVPSWLTTAAQSDHNHDVDYLDISASDNYFYTSNNTFANSTHIHGGAVTTVSSNATQTNVEITSASNGLTLRVPSYLTTAANSTHTHGSSPLYTNTVTNATGLTGLSNNTGLSLYIGKYITTAAQVSHTHGSNISTVGTTGTDIKVSSSSNGVTMGIPAYITTGGIYWQLESDHTGGTTSSSAGSALYLKGGDNITLSGSGGTIVISGNASGVGGVAVVGSDATYTSGSVVFRGTNITINTSAGGQYIDISAAAPAAAANEVATVAGGFLSLSSAGATTTVSVTGVMPLANSNNYFYTSNNTFANSTHDHGSLNMVTIAGTNITSSSASSGLSIGIPKYMGSDDSSLFIAKADSGLFQPVGAYALSSHTHGNVVTTVSSHSTQTNVEFSSSSNGLTVRVPSYITTAAQSGHTHGNIVTTVSSHSTQTNMEFSSSSNGLTIRVPAFITTAVAGLGGIAGSGAGTITNGTLHFSNANGVSFGLNGSTMTAIHNAFSHTTQLSTNFATISHTHGSNISFATSGDITASASSGSAGLTVSLTAPFTSNFVNTSESRSLYFVNSLGSNLTWGSSSTGNSTYMYATAGGGTGGVGGIAVSIGGNSTSSGSGYSNITSGTLLLAGGSNITLSQNGSRISIVGGAAGGANNLTFGGNVVGNSTVSGATLQLIAGNNITVSGANNSQFRIDGPQGSVAFSDGNGIAFSTSVSGVSTTVYGSVESSLLTFPQLSNYAGIQSTGITGGSATINSSQILINIAPGGGGGNWEIEGTKTAGTTSSAFNTLYLEGYNNVTLSGNSNTIRISVADAAGQSYQPLAFSGSNTSTTASTLTFGNLNNITHYITNGSLVASFSESTHAHPYIGSGDSTAYQTSVLSNTFQTTGAYITSQSTHAHSFVNQINGSSGSISFNVGSSLSSSANASSITIGLASNITTALQSANANYITSQSTHAHSFVNQINGSSGSISLNVGSSLSSSVNASGITLGLASNITTALQSANANYITVQSTHEHSTLGFAGSSISTVATNGTALLASANTGGISISIPAWITTYAAGGGEIAISAGIASGDYASIVFSNSNNVSFGLNGSTITASATVAATTYPAVQAINGTSGSLTFNGGSFLGISQNGSAFTWNVSDTSAITSAAYPSANTTKFAGTGFTTTATAGTEVVGTLGTNGLKLGVPAYITTALGGAPAQTLSMGYGSWTYTDFVNTVSMSDKLRYKMYGLVSAAFDTNTTDGVPNLNFIVDEDLLPKIAANGTHTGRGIVNFVNSNGVSFGYSAGTGTNSLNGSITASVEAGAGGPLVSYSGTVSVTDGVLSVNTDGYHQIQVGGINKTDSGTHYYVHNSIDLYENVFENYVFQVNSNNALATESLGWEVILTNGPHFGQWENIYYSTNTGVSTHNAVEVALNISKGLYYSNFTDNNVSYSSGWSTFSNWIPNKKYVDDQISTITGGGGGNWELEGTNTAGTTASAFNTLFLQAGNNITLSGNSNTVVFSVANAVGQTQQPMYFSASGTNTSANTLQFGNSNGITWGLSNGSVIGTVATNYAVSDHTHSDLYVHTNSTSNITSAALPSANSTQWATSVLSGSLMPLSYSSGFQTATLSNTFAKTDFTYAHTHNYVGTNTSISSGYNGSTLAMSANTSGLTLSVPAWLTAAAGGGAALQGSGTYTQNSGTIKFETGNGLTFGLTNNVMTGSYTVPTGSINFSDGSGVVWGSAVNGVSTTITASVAGLTGFSVSGNVGTTGSSNISKTNFVLAGGNNITLSQSNNTISIVGGAGGGGAAVSASNSLYSSGTVVISGSTNLTVSYNASTILLSVPNFYSATSQFSGSFLRSFYITGNSGTTGSSQITAGNFVLAGGNNITLNQSNNTISIVGGGGGGVVLGNTASSNAFTSGSVMISGANLTVNTSANGASQYLQISAPAIGYLYFSNTNGHSWSSSTSGASTSIYILTA